MKTEVGATVFTWNGTDDNGHSVGSGIYFYRMMSGDYVSMRRMLLIK